MRLRYLVGSCLIAVVLLAVFATPAFAHSPLHDQPDGNDWIMADWMLYSFLILFLASLFVFLVALKRGMFHNIEDAKYYILTIQEEDYYTPDCAKEK